jgi:hypothetical protein
LNISLKATVYPGSPVDGAGRLHRADRTLGIAIGNTCCALRCPDDELYHRLSRLYRNFLTEQTVDVTIELERSPRPAGPYGKAANGSGGARPGNEDLDFNVLSNDTDRFVAGLECDLTESDNGFRYMNRLFYMAYYTACQGKTGGSGPAMLVHACAILRNGRALLFAGPSESGKTTIARLCGEEYGRVINDEMVLITRPGADAGPCVQSVPIIGGVPSGINITVPLSCILLLKKGDKTQVRPVDPVNAYLSLITQTITPHYIGEKDRMSVLSLLADFSQEITGSVPVYELEFTLQEESLWREIDNLEGILYGKVK